MPISRSRAKRKKHKKLARDNPKTKHQLRSKQSGGIKLQIFYGLGFQIALAVLFAVFLSLGFHFLKERPEVATWMFFLSVVSVALAVTFFVQERLLYEPETSGKLRPANDPDPPAPPGCLKNSPAAFGVFYGDSVAYTSQGQVTIVEINGERLLSVERTPKGLSLFATVRSRDGHIVAEIVDNNFTINPNNYFKRSRPDKSTLVVYDQNNQAVLSVRYLNRLAVRVLGRFRGSNNFFVNITEQQTEIGAGVIRGSCSNDTMIIISA
jgi:hypothetical protein